VGVKEGTAVLTHKSPLVIALPMSLEFRKVVEKGKILDPSSSFEEKEVWVQIRWDPVTGQTVRIIQELGGSSGLAPEEVFKAGIEGFCPFCPDKVEGLTPAFPPYFLRDNRVKRGEAVLFPNLRPFDLISAVVVLGRDHFLRPKGLKLEVLLDGFSLARDFLKEVLSARDKGLYCYINWNFLPASGGSIVHPHIHAMAGRYPTNEMRGIEEGARGYYEATGRSIFLDLYKKEREVAERFLWEREGVAWFLSFAPRAPYDTAFIFLEERDFLEVSDNKLRVFLEDLKKVLEFYEDKGFCSFNLVLYGRSASQEEYFRVYGRVVGRRFLNSWFTSDINAFQLLHHEPVVGVLPEEARKEMVSVFKGQG